jgi:hypothetical protein
MRVVSARRRSAPTTNVTPVLTRIGQPASLMERGGEPRVCAVCRPEAGPEGCSRPCAGVVNRHDIATDFARRLRMRSSLRTCRRSFVECLDFEDGFLRRTRCVGHHMISVALCSTSSRAPLRGYGETAFALDHERRLVDQNIPSWNQVASWLRQVDAAMRAA